MRTQTQTCKHTRAHRHTNTHTDTRHSRGQLGDSGRGETPATDSFHTALTRLFAEGHRKILSIKRSIVYSDLQFGVLLGPSCTERHSEVLRLPDQEGIQYIQTGRPREGGGGGAEYTDA